MGKLKTWQEQLQEMVDNGISAAEEAQKNLSAKPFDYAEKFEADVREYSVKSLHKRYSDLSSTLFDQLRSANSRVGGYAGNLVSKLEKETVEQADTVSEAAEEAGQKVSRAAKSAGQEASRTAKSAGQEVSDTAQSAKKAVTGKTSESSSTAKTAKSASTAKSSTAKTQASTAKSEDESSSTSD